MTRSDRESNFEEQYRRVLEKYREGARETALCEASRAGRDALDQGARILDVVKAHLASANSSSELECLAESLAPFERALRRAPVAFLATGFDGAIHEANGAAAALMNTPEEALAGRSVVEFIDEADHAAVQEQLHDLQSGKLGRVEDWQIALLPRNGNAIPVAVTVTTDSTAGLQWLIRHASERKRGELKRTRETRRFEFLSEASSLLVGAFEVEASLVNVARLALPYMADWCFVNVVDGGGKFRQLEAAHADPTASAQARELRSYCLFATQAEEKEFSQASIVNGASEEWWAQAAESPEHAALLREFRGRSAMVIPLRSRGRLMGLMTFVSGEQQRKYRSDDLALGEDLARRCALALENARLYREVIAERDRAEKASRAKDEFLAILSHELRNPLMPVIGWTRVLREHALIAQDPTLAEGARSMERNARTLARLVDDCLDLARISEGKIRMERKPVDLNHILPASLEAVREMAAAKNLTMVSKPVEGSVLLLGDAVRLEQVVMNLLINAVKYTEAGGRISIRCSQCDGEAEVEVSDTGAGIHPAFLEQIFQPFRRGTTSWLMHQSGLGLGLAIARQIVEAHGGRIWAESNGLDCGSTFRVRLPMAAVAAPEHIRILAGVRDVEPSAGVHILVVEDSPDIVFLLQIELEMLGHVVTTALDGIAGLNLARAQRPDLIISDLKMPGLDGYELIREIRSAPELCEMPAIALTGFGAKADFDRAIAAGFDACISKPGEPQELSALIRKLTDKKSTTHHSSHAGDAAASNESHMAPR